MEQWIPVIVGIFGAGGIYALLKVRPEAGQIVVSAAQGAVIVQTGVIDSLRVELKRANDAIEEMRDDFEALRKERDALTTERDELKRRVTALEDEIRHLKAVT